MRSILLKSKSFACLFGLCVLINVSGYAENTTGTASVIESVQKVIPNKKIVLVGEAGNLSHNDKHEVYANLSAIAHKVLSDSITDLTTGTRSAKDLKHLTAEVKSSNADVCVVLIGRKDIEQKTPANEFRKDLVDFIRSIKTSKSKIYLMPSGPSFGAIFNSSIQTAANESGADYIQIGTEVSGAPFEEAFLDLASRYRKLPERGRSENQTKLSITPDKTIVESEISRIAGDLKDVETSGILEVPEGEPNVNFSKKTDPPSEKQYSEDNKLDTEETTGGKKILRKTGNDAYDTINMRPLPALKSFKPTIPVPRSNIKVKEPGLSRN